MSGAASRGPRLRGLLRVLGCVALVPIVVLGNPETAGAAGAWQQTVVTVGVDGFDDPKCTINLRLDDTAAAVELGGNSACRGGVDYTPGGTQPGEAGRFFIVSVSGTNDDQDACAGTTSGVLTSHPANGTTAVAGTFPASTIGLGGALPCVVTEVCVTFPGEGALEDDHQGCGSTVVTGPQPVDGACVHGQIHGVELIAQSNPRPGSSTIHDYWWEARVYFDDEGASNYSLWRVTKQTTASSDHSQVGISMLQNSLLFPFNKQGTTNPGQIEALLAASKPQGLQIYALDGVRNTPGTSSSDPSSLSIPQSYPITYPDGPYRGLTEPQQCRWWFGPKIVNFPTTETDEPAGPIDELNLPPEETEPEVETPPIEWEPVETEPSFWSLIAGLLRKLLGVLKAIASAIGNMVEAILDGLVGLFVPDPHVISTELSKAKDAWADTAPGEVLSTFTDFGTTLAGPTSSDCNGPELRIKGVSVGGNGSAGETVLHPLSTCSPAMTKVSLIARYSITLLVAVGAMVAGFRILSGGFGVNATPGAAS